MMSAETVSIFEATDTVGGLAAGFKDDDWDWYLEKFYHHWFQTDHDILNLIEEIGQSDKVFFPRPITRYWIDGHNYTSEITPQSVLFSLPLSLWGRLRMVPAGAGRATADRPRSHPYLPGSWPAPAR